MCEPDNQEYKDALKGVAVSKSKHDEARAVARRTSVAAGFLANIKRGREKLRKLVRALKYWHARVSLFSVYQLPDFKVAGFKSASREFFFLLFFSWFLFEFRMLILSSLL